MSLKKFTLIVTSDNLHFSTQCIEPDQLCFFLGDFCPYDSPKLNNKFAQMAHPSGYYSS